METIFSILKILKRLLLCDEIYFCALHSDCRMSYSAHNALEDCGTPASLNVHHHVSQHITTDNGVTHDYARAQKEQQLQAVSPLLQNKVLIQYMT